MENDSPFRLFAGLIGVNNSKGTTLMSQNHGTASGAILDSAIVIFSKVVSVTDNHIITNGELAFSIGASQGLFTGNLTNRLNSISGGIQQAHNISNSL